MHRIIAGIEMEFAYYLDGKEVWISAKEVAKLPDTTRSVLVLAEGNDKVLTAKFFPEWGWKLETCYRDDGYPKQTNIMFWAGYNLPK